MSGELQTIPARHGVATFVPRGRTIKIINTYGKQVVSTWAFALHQPPDGKEDGKAKEVAKEVDEKADVTEKMEESGKVEEVEKPKEEVDDSEEKKETVTEPEKVEDLEKPKEDAKDGEEDVDDPPEEAPAEEEKPTEVAEEEKAAARTWASYLPSIPYRSKTPAAAKKDAEAEKTANEATSKKWSAYIPTGKGFSSYVPNVPNVQMPSKETLSAFAGSHYRDPNKSYAEQLYDFSKTPVGAGSIAGTFSIHIPFTLLFSYLSPMNCTLQFSRMT